MAVIDHHLLDARSVVLAWRRQWPGWGWVLFCSQGQLGYTAISLIYKQVFWSGAQRAMQGKSYCRCHFPNNLVVNRRVVPPDPFPAQFFKSTASVTDPDARHGKRRSFSLTASLAW